MKTKMGYITQPSQLLISLQLLLLYSHQCSAILCSHDQSSTLLQFKQLFSFDKESSSYCKISRPKMMSWKEDADCCSWDGVTCDSATGHVIGLDLSCSWLHGNIPASNSISLFFLPRLQKLNLAFNDFNYSEISSGFINQFLSLTLLNLSSSNFMGSIPASLGNNITQLVYLDLSWNNFSGHIPSSFSNLQHLQHLNLLGNYFIGQIPDMFTNLTQLSYLGLKYNQLTGSIPSSIFELVNLTYISLSFNNLSGTVELYDFAKLKNLKYLYLSNISLSMSTKLTVNSSFPNLLGLSLSTCNLSEFPDLLKTQHQLELLDLSKNQIPGSIPSWMWDVGLHTLYFLNLRQNILTSIEHLPWKNLKYLILVSNLLQGSLPNLPPLMEYFSISMNNLTGEIPSSFCNLSSIRALYLQNNSLSGQIPECFGNSTLKSLNLGLNNFHGRIPQTYAKGCNLTYLVLNDNHLEGPLPPSSINCVNLSFLDVGNNNLSGPIPKYLGNSTSLNFLNVGNNSLSGQIPESLGNSTLEVLDMRMNKLSGSLPQIFTKSCVLASLNLNGNRLEGPLPPSLVNCQHLEVLDVGNNQIDDTFPHWLDALPELQVLILRSNRFWGPIGDTKTRTPFPKLRIIDLSHNQLTGFLPIWYLDSFKAMMHRDNNSVEVDYMKSHNFSNYYSIIVTVKGIEMQMERILTTFATIDLSSNRFQGGIPEVVGKLNSLKCLNISHNNLTGSIPSSFRNMTELESLDFSSNKLAGHIPMQLASLNYLSVLNLSNNLLEGLIPRGPQFNTFGNDSYFGNLGLCGFPLSESCSIDEASEPTTPRRFHEGDDAQSWFDWKFAKVGYASGVVMGLSIGYMVFVTGRPRWFVRMIERKQSKKVKRVIRRGRARRRNL